MRNFFWFLRRPRSKREALVYEKAYRQSFSVVAMILLVSLVVAAILGVSVILYDLPLMTPELSLGGVILFVQTFIVSILVAGIYSGWTVAREHKLSDGMKPERLSYETVRRVSTWLMITIPSIALFIIILVPGLFADIVVLLFAVLHTCLSVLAWKYAISLPTTKRFWMSLIVPVFTIYYAGSEGERDEKKRIAHVLAKTFASKVAYGFAVTAFLIMAGRLFIFKPVITYGATDSHAAEGEYAMMRVCNECWSGLQVDEFILHRDARNPRKTSVSRVAGVDPRGVVVESNGGKRLVPWNLVVAKGPVPTYPVTKVIGRHFSNNYLR